MYFVRILAELLCNEIGKLESESILIGSKVVFSWSDARVPIISICLDIFCIDGELFH